MIYKSDVIFIPFLLQHFSGVRNRSLPIADSISGQNAGGNFKSFITSRRFSISWLHRELRIPKSDADPLHETSRSIKIGVSTAALTRERDYNRELVPALTHRHNIQAQNDSEPFV